MKRAVLGATAFLWAIGAAAACVTPRPMLLTERFMSADCVACWSSTGAVDGGVLDWVAPGADDATLADKALVEALGRAPGLPPDRVLERQAVLSPSTLRVVDGIALNGYIGLQLEVTRGPRIGTDTLAYMALVERIGAGRDGTSVPRQLVRAVVGPLSLVELATQRRVRHLSAVRVPVDAHPERLASVAWLEDADGRVIAFTESARCR